MSEQAALQHNVYFTLQDSSPKTRAELIEGMRQYLSGHDGCVHFFAGTRVLDLDREVNDKDFDVVLSMIFESREAHDAYQVSDRHNDFIDAYSPNWSNVRVFDVYQA